jgi:hypothetical protein
MGWVQVHFSSLILVMRQKREVVRRSSRKAMACDKMRSAE